MNTGMVYISGGNELLDTDKIFDRIALKSGQVVADLGCGGAGHFAIPAGRRVGSQGLVYAVDILKSVLKSVVSRARLEGVSNIKTVWSNLEIAGATRIPKNSLDMAFLINILFQSKHDDYVIGEAVRLLKDGGKLLIIDWGRVAPSFGPAAEDRIKPETLKTIANKLSLKLTDEFEAGKYHFGLLFEK